MADNSNTTPRRRGTNLTALSVLQLGALYDAYAIADQVFLSLCKKPLCDGELEEIAGRRMNENCYRKIFVYQEALTRTPANGLEAEVLAAIICREAECGSEDWAAAGRAVAAVVSFRRVAA